MFFKDSSMNKFKKIALSVIIVAIAAIMSAWLTGKNKTVPKKIMIPAVGAVLWIWNIKPATKPKGK